MNYRLLSINPETNLRDVKFWYTLERSARREEIDLRIQGIFFSTNRRMLIYFVLGEK